MVKLKEKDIFEEAIVKFTSDNGCSGVADYPFLLEHGHNPSYHFRGKKIAQVYLYYYKPNGLTTIMKVHQI